MQISILKFALSLHIYSPKIEMYHQVAFDRELPVECSTVADVQGQLTCSIEEMENLIKRPFGDKPEMFNIDHHYPGSQNNSVGVVLYGELGTHEFRKFHTALKEFASSGQVDYVLRHYVKVSN